MKRHLTLLLAFCMLITSIPFRNTYANGQKEVPQGIVFDFSSGNLEMKFKNNEPTEEQKQWMENINSIKLNKQYYYKEGTTTGEKNYEFRIEDGKIIIENHVLVLKDNPIEIVSKGYKFYRGNIQNNKIEKMADGLEITAITKGTSATEPIGTYVGVSLSYKYDSSNGGALNYLLKNNVRSVEIDGKLLNYWGKDNFANILWQDGLFRTWDKIADAKDIVENFDNKTSHQFIISMIDGSKVIKTEDGYVGDNAEPKQHEKLSQVNTGGMAEGLEITGVGTPEKLGNALEISSDTPENEWYNKYFLNIRYILVDDNQGNDLRKGFVNYFIDAKKDTRDLTLFNRKLEFAMAGLKLLDNKAHKIEIGFKDENKIIYTQAGYVAPKEIKFDVKKYIAEQDKKQEPQPGNENTLAKRFQIERIGFTKNWKGEYDYSTPKIFFKNLPPESDLAERKALEAAMKDATFQIDGGEKITNVQGGVTRGLTPCFEAFGFSPYGGPALGKAIKEAGEDPHIVVTFSDNSKWDNKPGKSDHEEVVPQSGKKDEYPIENIIFKINGNSPQFELVFSSSQKAKEVGNEINKIKINGVEFDKSTFGYSMVTDHYISNAEEIGKALYGKTEIKIEITFNDGTIATKTVTIEPVEDPNASKPQPESPKLITKVDKATGVKAQYMSDVFEEGTEFKVEKIGKDKFFEIYKNAPKEIKDADNFTAYKVSFVNNGIEEGTIKNVKLIFPVGDHEKSSLALYQAYSYEDDEDGQIQTGADKITSTIEDNEVKCDTTTFTTYAIISDKLETRSDSATTVKAEFPAKAFKENTEMKVSKVEKDTFVNENEAVKDITSKAKDISAYDISFVSENEKQQPTCKVKITLPLGNHEKDSLKVYHYDKDGTSAPELVQGVKVDGEKIVFEVDKFSYYFVTSGVKEIEDTKKLNERFAIKEVKYEENSYGTKSLKISLKNVIGFNDFNEQKAFAKAIKEAKFIVNKGEEIKDVDGYWSRASDSLEVISDSLIEAIKNAGENPHIRVIFSDGSEWENRKAGETPTKTDNFDLKDKLPEGKYTIYFTPTREGKDEKFDMISGFFGDRGLLEVKKGKMFLSLKAKSNEKNMLDLAMKLGDEFKSGARNKEGLQDGQAIFTFEVKDLDKIQKLAVLVDIMGGKRDQIGQFDVYRKADLHFKAPIKKGFEGYEDTTDPEIEKKKNLDNLTLKLIAAGVKDLNNDGKLSPEELNKATGKLDLSGEKIAKTPDISMLKDLGPGVTGIELSSNDITEIPAGLFDKMTSITHINIYGNKLETLPKRIFDKNENLSTLWMSGNKLKDLDPQLLKNNKNLKEIDIANNGIEKLPEGFLKNATKLESIFLYENKLTSLDGVMPEKAKRLKKIVINKNEINALPEVFANYSQLEEITANNNKLKTLPKSFDKLKGLTTLDVANNEIESLPESIWLRLVENANKFPTKYPNLIVKGNLLKEVPFAKIAEKASGQRVRFNKFDVSCNYLKPNLTDDELEIIKKAGVTINDTQNNYYQPQRSAINAQANYTDGKVKVSQELDMLQLFYWNIGDINDWKFFKNPNEFKEFVKSKIYNKYKLRTENDQLGIAQVLDKDGWDWKIQNIIEKVESNKKTVVHDEFIKNEGHNGKLSDIDPLDSLNMEINVELDPNANYRLTRRLMLSKNNFETTFSYFVDFKTPEKKVVPQEDIELKKAKEALQEAVKSAEIRLNDGKEYTAESKKAVLEKIKSAKEVLNGNDKDAIKNAQKALEKALNELEEKKVVPQEDTELKEAKEALQKAVESAETRLSDGKEYTAESKKAVLEKIKSAKEVLNGNDKDAIKNAQKALEKALNELEEKKVVPQEDTELKEAKEALQKAVESAETRLSDGKEYTAESKKAVLEKIKSAKEVLKGKDKAAIKNAQEALEEVINGLKEEVVKPEPSPTPSPTPRPEPSPVPKSKPNKPSYRWNTYTNIGRSNNTSTKPIEKKEEKVNSVQKFIVNVPKEAFVKGYPDGSFRPNQKVVRSEIATMLAQFVKVNDSLANRFKDIKTSDWYFDSFKTLVNAGIITGYGDDNYRPNEGVTRAQAVTMIAKLKGLTPKVSNFKDVKANEWYAGYAGAAKEAGIVVGYSDGTFGGDKIVTRAEIIAMINRAFDIPTKESRKVFSDLPENHWAYKDIQKAAN